MQCAREETKRGCSYQTDGSGYLR